MWGSSTAPSASEADRQLAAQFRIAPRCAVPETRMGRLELQGRLRVQVVAQATEQSFVRLAAFLLRKVCVRLVEICDLIAPVRRPLTKLTANLRIEGVAREGSIRPAQVAVAESVFLGKHLPVALEIREPSAEHRQARLSRRRRCDDDMARQRVHTGQQSAQAAAEGKVEVAADRRFASTGAR